MNDPRVRPLSRVPPGRSATVVALAGGRAFQSRLVSMGLNVGCGVTVIRSSNPSGGPTLIAMGGTRLAIGYGMAEKIMVSMGPE